MKYIILFRGINVGGKNIVKMNDLKQLLLDLGLNKVTTYIQSGNALVETNMEESELKITVQCSFERRFGFTSDVIIRSIEQLETLINNLPITTDEITAAVASNTEVEHLYVYFLDNLPDKAKFDTIYMKYANSDILRFGKREAYLLCYQSIRDSKLAIHASKLFKSSTVRNWNTVNKLYDMLVSL